LEASHHSPSHIHHRHHRSIWDQQITPMLSCGHQFIIRQCLHGGPHSFPDPNALYVPDADSCLYKLASLPSAPSDIIQVTVIKVSHLHYFPSHIISVCHTYHLTTTIICRLKNSICGANILVPQSYPIWFFSQYISQS